MKIAVSTMNGGLEDSVSPMFGRCRNFTFVDIEGKEIKNTTVEQNQFAGAVGGAGIQAAQFIISEGADVIIAGNFGPNASSVFSQSK
ncbi:MAG: NifB/NifX family molybdenum-iron cluster-binding protein, partial [Methanomicrobia archaeon]|nr:NifB/NifX family molybdenum-iron cluster-binding protein [Methanomicrobia archaeon]